MNPVSHNLAVLALLLTNALAAGRLPGGGAPGVDRLGDPLPDGVLGRIGSSRLRHGGFVRKLAFTADGKWLVSGGDRGLRVWDAANGKLRRRINVDVGWNITFQVTAEGIAVMTNHHDHQSITYQLFDVASGRQLRRLDLPRRSRYYLLVLSHDGKRFVSTPDAEATCVYDRDGKELTRLAPIRDATFTADDNLLAVCDFSDTVRLHDVVSGKCVRRFQHKGDRVNWVTCSPDGRFLATIPLDEAGNRAGKPGEMSIWEIASGKELHRHKGPGGYVFCPAFSPDGKYVAMGCQHHELVLWDTATGKEVRRFPTDYSVTRIAFSPDGKAVAAASGAGVIRMWEVATGSVLPASADPLLTVIRNVRFSRDGHHLLGDDAMPIAWDIATGREVRRFFKPEDSHAFALSPDESLLADGDGEGAIRLRDARTGRELRVLKGHEKFLWRVAFAPDGRQLASIGSDNTVRVWGVQNGRQLHSLPHDAHELVFSPDGCWLASSGGRQVLVWDLSSGKEEARFALDGLNRPSRLAFASDSRLLAAVGGDDTLGEVKLWDIVSRKLRVT